MTELSSVESRNTSHPPEATSPLKEHGMELAGKPIGEIEVRPGEQSHISLGVFQEKERLKGFTTELTPEPQDEDAIVTHVARIEKENEGYELILHIANYGNKTVSAEIRQL